MSALLAPTPWNEGSSSYLTLLNRDDPVNGASNTAAIASADANWNVGGNQGHVATMTCENLNYKGFSDWYLPSIQEAAVLHRNRASLPVSSGVIWTSTERDESHAYSYNLGTGGATPTDDKWNSRSVLCVRKDASPLNTPEGCDGVTTLGATCGGGDLVFAGETPSGGALYTTSFPMSPVTWNDGSSSYLTLLNRDDPVNGAANTAAIASADANWNVGGTQGHLAAETCANMRYGGHDDWHLPSVQEAAVLHRNRASLPVNSGVIWTSTERDESHAYSYNLGTGVTNPNEDKWTLLGVQCVRSGPDLPAPYLGAVLFAGETPSGGALYTTSFPMSPVTWNDGSSSYLTLLNQDDPVNGAANTAAIASADANWNVGGTQGHLAAETCANMRYGGHDDWHLPSVQEAAVLHRNRASLPVSSGVIWTSTERDASHAYSYNLGTGVANPNEDKWTLRGVQCVRSGPDLPAPYLSAVLFAGETPSGGALYTTSFPMSPVTWNDGSSSYLTLLNRDDPVNGAANTAAIAPADANWNVGGTQGHLAAETCANMRYGGHDDWHLPSVQEAAVLHRNRASLPVNSGVIWTSTERDESHAYSYNLGTGVANPNEDKWTLLGVQCVRRDPGFAFAGQTCDPNVGVGSVCGNGSDIVRAGSLGSGYPLFTTVFPMAPVTWNDGSSSYLTLLNRDDPVNGAANTAAIAPADANWNVGGTQGHLAAETCANMTYAGRSDWYLPSVQEAGILYQNRASLPVNSGVIWTSTEQDASHAQSYNLGTGAATVTEDKWTLRGVQCVFAQTEYVIAQLQDIELTTGPTGLPWSADLSADLTINGGDPASRPQASDFSWSVLSGALPAGLSLNAETGVLSGTPQAVGSVTFTVEAAHAESGLSAQATVRVDTNPGSGVVRLYTDVIPDRYTVSADRMTMTRWGSETDYQRWMKADIRIPNEDQTYYWEVALSGGPSAWNGYVGIVSQHGDSRYAETLNPVYGDSIGWRGNGTVWGDGSEINGTVGTQLLSAAPTWTYGNGDVLMLAFNAKSGAFWIGKNGTWRNSPTSSPTHDVNGSATDFASSYAVPSLQGRDGSGQSLSLRSSVSQFSYPVPAGALPLADLVDMIPNEMSFAEMTGVEPGTLTVSNVVNISGINTATPISVSEGAEYQIGTNITWGPWTSETAEVTSGKRVRIRLTSGNFGETVTGNLYTGGVMTALSVTTRDALLQAEPFSFADAENRPLGDLAVSDAVTLFGPDVPDTISISGPSAEYSLNGGAYTSVDGMAASGDVISLRMPASSSYSETVAATLSVGPVSSTWSVTTSPGCGSVSVPGQICDDGQIVFAGDSPAGGAMFTTTFTLAAAPWNDGQTRYTTTNTRDPIDGAANTSALNGLDANSSSGGTQIHQAARACSNLVSSGYNDWYLPSVQEATVLYRNRGVLPVSPGQIWTSTEKDFDRAHSYNVGTGAVTSSDYKYSSRAVQCVRRGPAPLEAPGLVFVGDSVSGGALYTTPFTLAAMSWNDGDNRYTTTNRRDPINGAANTSTLNLADANSSDGGTQLHLAAASCARLSYGGHDDWYLPSVQEATVLYRNRGRLPVSPGQIWTSTEKDFDRAHSYNVGTGAVTSSDYKYSSRAVQCVRKGPAPLEAPGLVFVGDSVSGGALYTTPFTLAAVSWNDGDNRYTTTNMRDPVDGGGNTFSLNTLDANSSDGGTQLHLAAASCARLSYGGHDDWYLPSVQEATVLHRNRGRLPVSPGQIWTSTEKDFDRAHSFDVGTGAVTSSDYKYSSRAVQCVRRDPAPLEAPGLVFVGDSVSGGALYTTPFTLAAVSWNDGDNRYTTTNRRDPINGAANTSTLNLADANSSDGGTQLHLAAASCARLSYGGHDDWYLPSVQEATVLYRNRGRLPVSPGQIWTSMEKDFDRAHSYNVGTGAVTSSDYKYMSRAVQCVRKDPAPLEEPGLIFVGISTSGDEIYTTPFTLAPVSWNDGDNRYVTTSQTDPQNGPANTASLNTRDANSSDGGTQLHLAAASCARLEYGGHDDWYLPASGEMTLLFQNRGSLPVSSGQFWTSTEWDYQYAKSYNLGTGAEGNDYKYMSRSVQCVRRQAAPPPDPTVVFTEGFESFSGWSPVNAGSVSQTSDQARNGSSSALKHANSDPNGAYKMLDSAVGRNFELEAWVRSSDPRSGGGADRISIVDADGDGYGFNVGGTSYALDVRTGYNGAITSGTTWTRPENGWYRVVFRASPDNTFRIALFDSSGTELSSHNFAADTTHSGPFDRIAILGGHDFYVDDLKVTTFDAETPFWDSAVNRFKAGARNPRDIYGWAGSAGLTNVTISRDASVTDSPLGGTPLKMTVTGADPHIGTYNTWGGDWRIAPAANGETWEVRVLAKASAPTTIQTFIFGSDAAGVWSYEVGNIGVGNHNVSTEWQEFTYRYTFTSPNVQTFQTRLDGPQDGTPVDIWFDGLQVYKVE